MNHVLMKTSDNYLKLREVQDLFGVSRSTVWRWQTEQGLKVVRVGNVVRIRERDLQVFLSRHESQSAEAAQDAGAVGEAVSGVE